MRVTFGEIDKSGVRFSVEKSSLVVPGDADFSVVEVETAEIEARSRDEVNIDVTGRLAAIVRTECARCGCPVNCKIDEKFYYLVTLSEEPVAGISEKECSDEECETLYQNEPVIDFSEMFAEQLYLAIPQKVLCRDECSGICPDCGNLRDSGECNCSVERTDSPFAILKTLKKD